MGRQQSEEMSGFVHLVERQMLLYEERRKLVRTSSKEAATGPYRFIAISRDIGALGDIVASELAARLNWTVYDKEIVDYIVRDGRIRKSLVAQLDERAQDRIRDTVDRLFGMFEEQLFGNEEYHVVLLKTLATLAAGGNAILLGHGAAFALQEQPGLRVRITASPPVRVDRLSKRWGLPVEETRRRVLEDDADRRHFVQRHFKLDREETRFFHVVFNTDSFTVDQVVAAVMAIMQHGPAAEVSAAKPQAFDSIGFQNAERGPG
jgi:hypothetical protein